MESREVPKAPLISRRKASEASRRRGFLFNAFGIDLEHGKKSELQLHFSLIWQGQAYY